MDPVFRLWDQHMLTDNTLQEIATTPVPDNPQMVHAKGFVAVAAHPQEGDTAEHVIANEKPDGFVTAVIDFGHLVHTLIGSRPPQGYDVEYFGSARDLDLGTPFHRHLSRRSHEQGELPWSLFPNTGYRWSNVINVADQTWTVVSRPLGKLVINEVYLPAVSVLLIGLAMAVLSTSCLRSSETRRLQAEKFSEQLRRSQRLEAVGQLSGGIAHDFNNLLGAIMGNLELLQRMVADQPKAVQRVDKALRAASRGRDEVARLQAFSSLEPRPGEPTDANTLIGDLMGALQKSLTNQIALEFRPAAGLWLTDVDPADLSTSLVNLVFNAHNAMPLGGRSVIMTENRTVSQESGSEERLIPGDYVVVTVSDTGTGMPPAVRDRAIEPFYTAWPDGGGGGLGLSMVYGFAKRSRGHLRIHSSPGQGTTVHLYMPRSASAVAKPARHDAAEDKLRGAGVVLVVDDEPDLRDIAETILRDLGYATISARDGREAQTILRNGKGAEIELVLSDVIMPGGIDGFELAEWIRKARPGIKVLLTSGFTGKLAECTADPTLMRTMVKKPYSKMTLARAVKEALVFDTPDPATPQSHPRQTTANDVV
jgi:signal transduction histidine kinase/FixJ family two-component response regulator